MSKKYSVGIDFGTLSGRAVVADVETGEEISDFCYEYPHGVMDEIFSDGTTKLPPKTALQHPMDYIEVLQNTVPGAIKKAGITPDDVIGVGIDFTSCSILPIDKNGIPLCFDEKYKNRIHAYVKLWKDHSAQAESDLLEKTALARNEDFMKYYDGRMSPQWMFPKILHILNEDEEIYNAADRFIECGDWIVLMLTGRECRSLCHAGFKASWNKKNGYPSEDFFAAVDERLRHVAEKKLSGDIFPLGSCAGFITKEAAALTGLNIGTPVGVSSIDAHVALPVSGVINPGDMLMIIGTSTCHIMLGDSEKKVPGIFGMAEDGIIPGYFAYEAGQACVGDHFDWFIKNGLPYSYYTEAKDKGINPHQLLTEKAKKLKPGESGLIALDWFNGNRSVLMDSDLSGMILGYTLRTKPEEIYRALIEATGFGTRMIIESFENSGTAVNNLYASGGIAGKNPMMMQIYADITKKDIKTVKAVQPGARGAALLGAVAAGKKGGGYDTIKEAAAKMKCSSGKIYRPIYENSIIYDKLFDEYKTLHDYFGRGKNDVMKRIMKK